VAEVGGSHVVGHLQINSDRPAIFSSSDLAERPGAIRIGVEKAKPSRTCGRPAGGPCPCFTLASLHDCSFSYTCCLYYCFDYVLSRCGNFPLHLLVADCAANFIVPLSSNRAPDRNARSCSQLDLNDMTIEELLMAKIY